MTYQKAISYLYSRRAKNMKLGLEHIVSLLEQLGNPQKFFKSIHIAGTNGKGSTAAILDSVLRHAGYNTGLYTSPHLINLRERIRTRGHCISELDLLSHVVDIQAAAEDNNASFFEILTAIAFKHFSEQQVDIAIVETGLGGRLDATNTLLPEISVITEIGLDHTRILGKHMKKIASEKAGILKKGIPGIIGSQIDSVRDYYREIAKKQNLHLRYVLEEVLIENIRLLESGTLMDIRMEGHEYKDLNLHLPGCHQVENAATVLCTIDELRKQGWKISDESVYAGFAETNWRARLELIQIAPKIVLDSAHNPLGAKRLVNALESIFQYTNLILVFGVLADKDYESMAKLLFPLSNHLILTKPPNERGLNPEKLLPFTRQDKQSVDILEAVDDAWKKAMEVAQPEDLICACGSIYFVGEILQQLGEDNCSPLA